LTQRLRISLDGGPEGPWQFQTDPDAAIAPGSFGSGRQTRPITVPAPWQSQGAELRDYAGAGWYARDFDVAAGWLHTDQCVILHFGAVDYRAEVWVNEQRMGCHEGGYLPFEFDITNALRVGVNRLAVRVEDSSDIFNEIPHGKQSWYGMLSGIWQPVWLELRPRLHVVGVRVAPDVAGARVSVEVELNDTLPAGAVLRCEIIAPSGSVVAAGDFETAEFVLQTPEPVLWDVLAPNLYIARVTVSLSGDSCDTSFGFRTIETRDGKLLLNGQPLYLRAALDQDYYPELISTPPSYEYIEREMRQALQMGFNCLRIHIKVADPRYYDAADRLGLLIWTELPNHARLMGSAAQRARETITGMVLRDWSHPSIIIWTIINENWGLDITDPEQRAWLAAEYDWLKAFDPTRLVVDNSSCWGNAHVVTDIEDFHNYYAMPDHFNQWREWVSMFAKHPWWSFAHLYRNYPEVRQFMKDPWHAAERPPALEIQRKGDEPLVVSEFGNWGLPDLDQLHAGYGGREPWWFETGHDWGDGVAYPHGIEERFRTFHLQRAFVTLKGLIQASQRLQTQAFKAQIEEMRRHAPIQGYVVTEFTDVHWEANGVLDMHRNPKQVASELPQFNADDVVFAQLNRTTYASGEEVRLRVFVSHYSDRSLDGARIEWEAPAAGERGAFQLNALARGNVGAVGTLRFTAPQAARAGGDRVLFRLLAADGAEISRNYHELWFFPARRQPGQDIRLYSPDMAEELGALGYALAQRPEDAAVMVARTATDDLREQVLGGGRLLWLAETKKSRRTYLSGISLKEREDEVWEGNWASALLWINRDRVFRNVPGDGTVDFMFYSITPEHILKNFRAYEFATQVHAGLSVGWVHDTVVLVGERPVGRGHILGSTFRISCHLQSNPLAALMLDEMVTYLAKR
jgi:hypothetical protein